MTNILGIVMVDSYYFRDIIGNYLIEFSMQIDSKEYIYGELYVRFISEHLHEFKTGDRIEIKGSLQSEVGMLLEATSIKRLPLYY